MATKRINLSVEEKIEASTKMFKHLNRNMWPKNATKALQTHSLKQLFDVNKIRLSTPLIDFTLKDLIQRLSIIPTIIIPLSTKNGSLCEFVNYKILDVRLKLQKNSTKMSVIKTAMEWVILVCDFFQTPLRLKAWNFITKMLLGSETELRSAFNNNTQFKPQLAKICNISDMTVRKASLNTNYQVYSEIYEQSIKIKI
jgi:hypothetical protein